MIPIKFFNNKERENFLKKLDEQFGIKEFPKNVKIGKLGKERIILFSGDISEEEIEKIGEYARIEGIGMYFAKEQADGIRLSIEGTEFIKDKITKNIFEMNKEQAEQWMYGYEIQGNIKEKGFYIMKFKNDFLGTGKASENRITNFVPKSRRLKFKETKNEEE
jgi:NOL1/NOP2/fmu family ribosome biogenesis protein